MILTFILIAGAFIAGTSLRLAVVDRRYATTEIELENRIDKLVYELNASRRELNASRRELNASRQWAAALERDAIKNQTYAPRTTLAFSEAQ